MASGIETRTQLYEILDKIQDNLNSNDTYSNMKLYFNEMMKTAVIYQIVGEEGLSNDINIVAIFNPERILLSELEYFKGAILKNVNVINVDSIGINEVGLGGFIDFDRLINNICVALGVKLGKNFAKNNPLIYSELRNICIKYTSSLNNSPYFMQEAGTSYYSLVPYNIVLDVAIYLNSIGLFDTGDVYELFDTPLGRIDSVYYPTDYANTPISDYYNFYSERDFVQKHIPNYLDLRGFNKNVLTFALNSLVTEYEDEIDWSNPIVFYFQYTNTYTTLKVSMLSFDKNCMYAKYNDYRCFLRNVNESSVVKYKVRLINSNDNWTITYSKDTVVLPSNTTQFFWFYDDSIAGWYADSVNNINYDKYIKYYGNPSDADNFLPHRNSLTANVFRELNFISSKYYGLPYIFERNNLSFSDKDMMVADYSNSTYHILIFRNASETRVKWNTEFWGMPYCRYMTNPYTTKNNSGTDGWNVTFTFESPVVCETYDITTSNMRTALSNTETVSTKTVQIRCYSYHYQHNLGEVVEMKPPEVLQDITLESGATYPQTVIDSSTFISTYPNWYRQESYQPEIDEDGQVLNSRTATTWINLDVDSPSNQSEAQEGNLDNADLDSLIRDIDKAEEDDDTNDPSSDDDAEDGGGVEETDPEDVPSTLVGLLQQAVFPNTQEDAQNLYNFITGLYSTNFLDVIKNLALGNPIDGIVSFVASYDGLWNEESVTTKEVILWGQTLTWEHGGQSGNVEAKHINNQIKEIDLGTIDMRTDIPPEYTEDNYTDITERELGLYLPFVGLVNLDIRDFIDKKLQLIARVDSMTGTIVYNVNRIYDDGGKPQLVQTFSGNCQAQIPLNSVDFSQLMRNIANTTLGAVGALSVL